MHQLKTKCARLSAATTASEMAERATSCRKRRRRLVAPINHHTQGRSICAISLLLLLAIASTQLLISTSTSSDNKSSFNPLIPSVEAQQVATTIVPKQQQQQQQQQPTTTQTSSSSSTTQTQTPTPQATSSTQAAPSASSQPTSTTGAQAKRDLTSTTSARSQQLQLERDATATANRRSGNVCQVNDGESVAILEIEESRGSDMGQRTSPRELPISGAPGEIELKIESETHRYFEVRPGDKSLRLVRPLDRDAVLRENSTTQQQQPITSIYLQVSCTDKRRPAAGGVAPKKVIIPVLVKVLDLNDNAPKFSQASYAIEVNELAPVGTVVMDQFAFALDLDSASNGQVEYSLLGDERSQLPPVGGGATASSRVVPLAAQHVGTPTSVQSASQRLIQRAPPPESSSSTPRPATSTILSTTTARASDSAAATTPAAAAAAAASSSASSEPQSVQTSAPPSGGQADSPADDASEAPASEDDKTWVASSAPQSQARPNSGTRASGPTINLDSEPIVNGPMEEPDEDESDEALLAALNPSSGNSTGDSDSESLSGGRRRAARRRRSPQSATLTTPTLTTTTASVGNRKQLPLTTTTARVPPFRVVDARAAGANTQQQQQQPPWTNLMIVSNEDLRSLEAGTSGTAATTAATAAQSQATGTGSDQPQAAGGIGPAGEQQQSANSNDFFALELSTQTNRPVLRLKRQLDYESQRVHVLTLVATDRAANKRERLSSQARIIIRVLDGDDQPPAFVLDQVGCATSSLPRTTTPLPGGAPLRGMSAPASADSAPQEIASPRGRSNNNLQLRSFMITDENFDFGDTLALDDTPLDDEQAGTGVPGGVTLVATPPPAGVARTRRVPSGRQPSSQQQQGSQRPPAQAARSDYSCLPPATMQQQAQQNSNGSNLQPVEYFATVISGDSDYLLRILPQAIRARDRDELQAPIRYSLAPEGATPANFSHYFQINPLDATIKQVAPVERAQVSEFTLYVRAQEQTYNKLYSVAKLTIDVLPTDKSPPVLAPNSYSGFVDENSPLGTRVQVAPRANSSDADYLRISVLDADSPTGMSGRGKGGSGNATPPKQPQFEFETTSEAFKVDREGYVYVNKFPLDRDVESSPLEGATGAQIQTPTTTTTSKNNQVHMFQVTARQVGLASSHSVSSPVSLNITLNDLNDNPPALLNASLAPVAMAAQSAPGGAHELVRLQALDRDTPENARAHFSLQHVSNGGGARFRVDEESGRIEALGRFVAGEQFSLSVQVADDLGRASQGILEVRVVPGANTGPPQFLAGGGPEVGPGALETLAELARDHHHHSAPPPARPTHSAASFHQAVEVNEAVPVGSVVTQVRALDPEQEAITYSLIGGNTNGDFSINSRTGALLVANKLDREEIQAYRLVVQARDSGGLATSRPLHIQVSDANDQNPVFTQSHYVFSVEETVLAPSASLGRVLAQDGDEGDNGRVSYSLVMLGGGGTGAGPAHSAPYAVAEGGVSAAPAADSPHQTTSPFVIDEQTGELRLTRALDYERERAHTLMVVARDHGESPRASSAMVEVKVLDRQDELPYFETAQLVVRLDENAPAGTRVAGVQARDPDSVAQVTYVLLAGGDNLFQIDAQTGVITTTATSVVDFELKRHHSLLVGTNESLGALGTDLEHATRKLDDFIARAAQQSNGGQQPPPTGGHRWPVMRAEIHVNDLNDNAPQFEDANGGGALLPVRLQDTLAPGSPLDEVRLVARDADGSAPNNQVRYELVVAAGTTSSPSELVTSERCARLFLVDALTCQVSVRQDLRATAPQLSECQLVIRARDTPLAGSEHSLSSTVTLTIYIDHLAELSPASLLTFADSSYTLELAENVPANTLVKVLPVISRSKQRLGGAQGAPPSFSCEILSGNELNRFYVTTTTATSLEGNNNNNEQQRDSCELRTRDHLLDYEQRQRHLLVVKLNTHAGAESTAGGSQLTRVQINLLDRNDNRPVFAGAPARYGQLTGGRHLAAVARDAPPDTQLAQLRASDADSPQANGLISYELFSGGREDSGPAEGRDLLLATPTREDQPEGRFRVDPVDGILRTSKPLEDIPATRLPLRLRLVARDNPAQEEAGAPLEAAAELVVNLIEDQHRLVLVLRDTPPARVLDARDHLLAVLQERTGLISGLERIESLRVQSARNSTAATPEVDPSGTDVWFYLVEPGSLRIVPSDDPRLKAALFESRAQNSLADILAASGLGVAARARVRLPYALTSALLAAGGASSSGGPASLFFGAFRADSSRDRLAPALILIAIFIALASAIVVIYQCGSVAAWSESARRNSQMPQQQQQQLAPPGGPFLPSMPYLQHPMALHQQQQQQQFTKDKFLFSQPPPPPCSLGDTGGQYSTTGGLQRSSFSSGSRLAGDADTAALYHSHLSAGGDESQAAAAKEYETQMLKMSVLFDDSQSFAEHSAAANMAAAGGMDYADHKNLV